MNINIFLVCYNESVLLPHTITHYKKYLPSCKITIYDNQSTDNSVDIAKSLGCDVIEWNTQNITNELMLSELKNNCWKHIKDGWIIMADMDEFLCITEENLLKEFNNGTTILQITGIDMIGESQRLQLTDINLQNIKKYVDNPYENKFLCFLREKINEMNYDIGSHTIEPIGQIVYSQDTYINKHMNYLGLIYYSNKMILRYDRSHEMRKKGHDTHYTNSIVDIKIKYMDQLKNCKILG